MPGKKKWRKHIPSDAASFRRPRGSKPPAHAILIVTEGVVTEPVYFETLRSKLALQTVEIEIVGEGKGDPRKLVEAALNERNKRKKENRSGKLSLSKAPDFDELWIVFDTDVPLEHGRYHDGIALAESKGVSVAQSTPCFEFWLLLHLEYTTAQFKKFADIKPVLKKALGGKYEKDCKDSAKSIPPLVANLDTAVKRAEQVRKHHEEAGTEQPPNPSTDVDLLITAIRSATTPANA